MSYTVSDVPAVGQGTTYRIMPDGRRVAMPPAEAPHPGGGGTNAQPFDPPYLHATTSHDLPPSYQQATNYKGDTATSHPAAANVSIPPSSTHAIKVVKTPTYASYGGGIPPAPAQQQYPGSYPTQQTPYNPATSYPPAPYPTSAPQYPPGTGPSPYSPYGQQYSNQYGGPVHVVNLPAGAQPQYDSRASMSIPGRMAFIRRTYAILTIQLAVTTGFILLFLLHDGVKNYVQHNPALLYSALILSLVLVCALACFRSLSKTWPINVILLGLFTLCEAYLLGTITSYYDTSIVLQAIVMVAAITLALTLYAWQTKRDLTKLGAFLAIGIMVLIFGFLIRLFLPYSPLMETIWACFGALLFAGYLLYDTFLLIHILSPDEYITACLMLYLDIANMFLFILQLLGGNRRD